MTDEDSALLSRAHAWADDDLDPATRAELDALIAQGDLAGLHARFDTPLGFGTAGLRGAIGAGPGRMNRAVVARTTAGLCAVLAREVPDAARLGLCVGFDGRHQSREFAAEVATAATGAGFVVYAFDTPVPTPLLAFSALDRGAAAGVMITASHNPATDNGYKVYWCDGAQILSPHDTAVSAAANTQSSRSVPRCTAEDARARGLLHTTGPAPTEAYLRAITRDATTPGWRRLRIAYTPVHGVGEPFAREALSRAGFTDVHSVAAQAVPDPDFPTAPRPNPEEPGVMSLVRSLAEDVGADLVLANDPDADRLAVAARDGNGALRAFTGNEVGALLADDRLAHTANPARALVIGTIVSTPLVAAIARAHGAQYAETLTGFKWIMRRARDLERERGVALVLGFEEALGYAVCSAVRDKDGISAAIAIARLAAREKAQGRTLVDRLHDLWLRHGVHASGQVSLTVDVAAAAARMAALRVSPPESIANLPVVAVVDLANGTRRTGERVAAVELPPSDVLTWELAGGHRITFRPSGTEPRLKIYLDVVEPLAPTDDVGAAEARARARMAAIAEALTARLRE